MRKSTITSVVTILGIGAIFTAMAVAAEKDADVQIPLEDEQLINEVIDTMDCDEPVPTVVEGSDGLTHVVGCVTLGG